MPGAVDKGPPLPALPLPLVPVQAHFHLPAEGGLSHPLPHVGHRRAADRIPQGEHPPPHEPAALEKPSPQGEQHHPLDPQIPVLPHPFPAPQLVVIREEQDRILRPVQRLQHGLRVVWIIEIILMGQGHQRRLRPVIGRVPVPADAALLRNKKRRPVLPGYLLNVGRGGGGGDQNPALHRLVFQGSDALLQIGAVPVGADSPGMIRSRVAHAFSSRLSGRPSRSASSSRTRFSSRAISWVSRTRFFLLPLMITEKLIISAKPRHSITAKRAFTGS